MEEEKKVIEKKEEEKTDYELLSKPKLDLFKDVISDEREREILDRKYPKKSRMGKTINNLRQAKLSQAMKNILASDYCELEDGSTISVAERIGMLTVGYTIANPTPKNVKTLQEISGDNVVKVDVSGNVGIDKFFEDVAADEDED